MTKKIRDAVSVVIVNSEGKTLFAFRNDKEKSFPLVWSLPSSFVKEGEDLEDTINRIGRDKLGIGIEIGTLLKEGQVERENFTLFMHDYSAEIISGTPRIQENDPYKELKWEFPEKQFAGMKEMGECCKLYKQYLGV